MLKTMKNVYSIEGNFLFEKNGEFVKQRAKIYIKNGLIDLISYGLSSEKKELIAELEAESQYDIILEPDDIVYPGLIDLHTHYQYNMMPIWERHQDTCWDNRFEWRANKEYKEDIENVYSIIKKNWNRTLPSGKNTFGDLFLYYSELQAIAGGTTVMQEPNKITVNTNEKEANLAYSFLQQTQFRSHLLIRSTGRTDDLGLGDYAANTIFSITDFFRPKPDVPDDLTPPVGTAAWIPDSTVQYHDFAELLKEPSNLYRGYLVHLAEGRCGNLLDDQGIDAYCKLEFEVFKEKVEEICVEDRKDNLKKLHFGIIHGCGIDLNDINNIQFLKEHNIGIIWSPVSNLLLYKDTPAFYEKLRRYPDIVQCLGSDWSPSGSKYVWDEGKFAYKSLRSYNVSDDIMPDVFKMMTTNPAKLLGADKVGSIRKGAFADFFVIGNPKFNNDNAIIGDAANPLTNLFNGTDANTKLVIVGGRVIYGERKYFEDSQTPYQKLPSEESPFDKVVYVPEVLQLNLSKDIKALNDLLSEHGVKRSHFLAYNDLAYQKNIKKLQAKFTRFPTFTTTYINELFVQFESSLQMYNAKDHSFIHDQNVAYLFQYIRGTKTDDAHAFGSFSIQLSFRDTPEDETTYILMTHMLETKDRFPFGNQITCIYKAKEKKWYFY